jgi:hypothetical protein
MIFTKNESLEDILPQILLEERPVAYVLSHEKIRGRLVTVQAVYKALRKLVDEGVVVKHRKFYVTSREWLDKLEQLQNSLKIFVPKEGESVRFTFSSFTHTDAYWEHVVRNLPKNDLDLPLFAYLPHNFWIHNPKRFENEAEYYAHFLKENKNGYVVIGSDSEDDLRTKKLLRNEYLHINTIAYPRFRRTEHIAVMGQFITTTKVSLVVAREIDALYETHSGEELLGRLKKIFERKATIKITLENSPEKANALRKILGKDFYIPKRKVG